MKKMIQKGFTLIELMIVIAIIGILAAIAMPAYQDYIARSQATEGFKATSGLQTDLAVFYADQKTFVGAGDDKGISQIVATLKGKYFNTDGSGPITLGGESETSITITIPFNYGANKDKNMTLVPTVVQESGQVQKWTCGGTIEARRLPGSCRT